MNRNINFIRKVKLSYEKQICFKSISKFRNFNHFKKGDSIDLSEASLSLEGATLGISLDGETSTDIKIETK